MGVLPSRGSRFFDLFVVGVGVGDDKGDRSLNLGDCVHAINPLLPGDYRQGSDKEHWQHQGYYPHYPLVCWTQGHYLQLVQQSAQCLVCWLQGHCLQM